MDIPLELHEKINPTLYQRVFTLNENDDIHVIINFLSGSVSMQIRISELIRILSFDSVTYAELSNIELTRYSVNNDCIQRFSSVYQSVFYSGINEESITKIEQAVETLILKYKHSYGYIQIFNMEKSIPLDDIFTPFNILDRPSFLEINPEEIHEQSYFFNLNESKVQVGKRIENSLDILDYSKKLILLGPPGSGKSTLLRKITLDYVNKETNYSKELKIPVLIELKYCDSESFDLYQVVVDFFRSCGFPYSETFVSTALKNDLLILLFDGIDEVHSKNLKHVHKQIVDFIESNLTVRMYISCRTASWKVSYLGFDYIQIADFNINQINQFIKNWFIYRKNNSIYDGNKCFQLLKQDDHKSTLELAKNPLLLSFICIVYETTKSLPNNRANLYDKALNILLENWLNSKDLSKTPYYQKYGIELEKHILSTCAFHNFMNGDIFFTRKTLIEQIDKVLKDTKNIPNNIKSWKILEAIELEQGIFVERARDLNFRERDIFSFSHLSIQEYLVARHLSLQSDFKSIITDHLTDTRWKEVILLLSGIIGERVEDLILLYSNKTKKFLQTSSGSSKLAPILNWANQVITTNRDLEMSVSKRCLAVAFASANAYALSYGDAFSRSIRQAFALAYDSYDSDYLAKTSAQKLTYAYSLAHCHSLTCSYVNEDLVDRYANPFKLIYAYALAKAYIHTYSPGTPSIKTYENSIDEFIGCARELSKINIFNAEIDLNILISRLRNLTNSIPTVDSTHQKHKEFSLKIINTWTTSFQLKDLISINRNEIENIGNNYFYPNLMMVKCSQVSTTITNKFWNSIELNMLRNDY